MLGGELEIYAYSEVRSPMVEIRDGEPAASARPSTVHRGFALVLDSVATGALSARPSTVHRGFAWF
jgi:hypothetical protein